MKSEIKLLQELCTEEKKTINKYLLEEFDEFIIDKLEYSDGSRFLLLKEGEEIVSFCRIFDTQIKFQDVFYDTLALTMVYSVKQGKGNGKTLIDEVKKIAEKEGKIILGNCEPKNEEFYLKCGMKILGQVIKRFVYINKRNIGEINQNDTVVFTYDPDGKFTKTFVENKNDDAYIFERWW